MTSFAEFRDTYQYRGDKIYELIYERHKYSLRGKRPEVLMRNLKAIFESAFEISQERGFYAMSLRELSKSSELSIGALYGCINSKNDIPNIACDTISFLRTEFLRNFQERPASDKVLMSHIRHSVYLAEIWEPWFRFLSQETQHLDDESRYCISSLDQSQHKLLCALIRQQQDYPYQKDSLVDTVLIPRTVISLVDEWCLRNEDYKNRGITVDRYAAALVDLISRLLK